MSREQVKILLGTPEIYKTVVKELETRHTESHTFKPKQERNFRVVLKNMHPSTDLEVLKTEINSHGHNVANIWNVGMFGM